MHADVLSEFGEDLLLFIVGRSRSGPIHGALDEPITAFLQLSVQISQRLQVLVFIRPSFTEPASQGLDAPPMLFENSGFALQAKSRFPRGLKLLGRLLDGKHQVRPVVYGA